MKEDSPSAPLRQPRFFGVHFDFHATEADENIGPESIRALIGQMLDEVQPDFVQCDSKGHPGVASYPTKVGHPAPGLGDRDPLRIWSEEASRRGIPLYVHHSGVWDTCAVRDHPEWARVKEDGTPDPDNTSVFSNYRDQRLIPQICEMAEQYGIRGVWLDGECWAAAVDYSPEAVRQFTKETGLSPNRLKAGSEDYEQFREFCREGFRNYLRCYVDEVHRRFPNLQIASNWAFSSLMPEPVSANVDFLSGDYPTRNSVNLARFEARCLQHQGKLWDLMAWGFAARFGDAAFSPKSAVQLCQEAAITLAAGGGFQVYFRQQRDGGLRAHHLPLLREVARFCRERQEFCHSAETVPQIGVLFSKETFYQKSEHLFSVWNSDCLLPERGALQCLLDTQNVADVLMDHQLPARVRDYPLIVIPDGITLGAKTKSILLDYVNGGGSLLTVGPTSSLNFQNALGVTQCKSESAIPLWVEFDGNLAGLQSAVFDGKSLPKNLETFGRFYLDEDIRAPAYAACHATTIGMGTLAFIPFDCTARYLTDRSPVLRDFFGSLVRWLFPNPRVLVSGSHRVDVCLMKKGAAEFLHLINMAGAHDQEGVNAFDEVPNSGPIEIRFVPQREAVSQVIQLPGNASLSFTLEETHIVFTLPKLHLHAIFEIRYQL